MSTRRILPAPTDLAGVFLFIIGAVAFRATSDPTSCVVPRLDRLTVAEIDAYTDACIRRASSAVDSLLAKRGPRTVQNTLRPYDDILQNMAGSGFLNVLRVAHPDTAIRSSAVRAQARLRDFRQTRLRGPAIFDLLASIDTTGADAETRFYIATELRALRHDGANRDAATKPRIESLRREITRLEQRFGENIAAAEPPMIFEREADLDGVPSRWLATMSRGPQGEVLVPAAELQTVIGSARDTAVRERAFVRSMSRAAANHFVLDSLLRARYALATLLGYPSWAHYQLAVSMVGSAEKARAFLDEFRTRTTPMVIRAMAQRARILEAQSGMPLRAIPLRDFAISARPEPGSGGERGGRGEQSLRRSPYFAYPRVRDELITLARELFDLEFRRSPDIPVWHPLVEAFRVYENGREIGVAYLDNYQRPGKAAGPAATHPMRVGQKDRVLPEAAITSSIVRDTVDRLIRHQDVVTFFHEFGHLLNFLLAVRTWHGTSGAPWESDFRELPSVFFQQLAVDSTVLRRFARHYRTNEPIPDSLLASLVAPGANNSGLMLQWRARMSLDLHDRAPSNIDSIVRQSFQDAQPQGAITVVLPNQPIHPEAAFSHLSGYGAQYYTYLWSNVIAQDMLSRFEHGMLDTAMTHRYRRTILEPAGSQPAMQMIENFLGRPFRFDAWAHTIGR